MKVREQGRKSRKITDKNGQKLDIWHSFIMYQREKRMNCLFAWSQWRLLDCRHTERSRRRKIRGRAKERQGQSRSDLPGLLSIRPLLPVLPFPSNPMVSSFSLLPQSINPSTNSSYPSLWDQNKQTSGLTTVGWKKRGEEKEW